MANTCLNRLFVSAAPRACTALLADVQGRSPASGENFSFAALVPEPDSAISAGDVLGPERARWRQQNWGTTVDPLAARQGGDPREGGLEFEFETSGAPLAWVESLAMAHPHARLHLLFDCSDEQRAGEVIYEGGVQRRSSEIAGQGYELWLERAAEAGIYGEHEPPYLDVSLD